MGYAVKNLLDLVFLARYLRINFQKNDSSSLKSRFLPQLGIRHRQHYSRSLFKKISNHSTYTILITFNKLLVTWKKYSCLLYIVFYIMKTENITTFTRGGANSAKKATVAKKTKIQQRKHYLPIVRDQRLSQSQLAKHVNDSLHWSGISNCEWTLDKNSACQLSIQCISSHVSM